MYPISLDNYGFIRTKLPSQLYQDLLKECLQAARKNPPMVSGLTGKGVGPHYFIINKSNLKNLTDFVLQARHAYDKAFPGLGDTGVLSRDCPYSLTPPWLNLQRKGQFVPEHIHDGVYSYTIWMKIPYDIKKENPLYVPGGTSGANIKKINANSLKNKNLHSSEVLKYASTPSAGFFQFSYASIFGGPMSHKIPLSKKEEGEMILFPSKLNHIVYPFYTSSGTRISISGNIIYDVG